MEDKIIEVSLGSRVELSTSPVGGEPSTTSYASVKELHRGRNGGLFVVLDAVDPRGAPIRLSVLLNGALGDETELWDCRLSHARVLARTALEQHPRYDVVRDALVSGLERLNAHTRGQGIGPLDAAARDLALCVVKKISEAG